MSASDGFLVTGGNGFLGAWVVRELLSRGARVSILDLASDDRILSQVLDPGDLERVARWEGDVAGEGIVERALEESGAAGVIHLAALQLPACRDRPVLGATVNVLGTLRVFEAVRRGAGGVRPVVYASSAAVAGPPEEYPSPIPDEAPHRPRTHYGVFKLANEGNASVYWRDHGIPSVGLRPLVVYGPGREVGLTSGATKAIKAAFLGREYAIRFAGTTVFHYAEDVARAFVACSLADVRGALALNLPGDRIDVEGFVRALGETVPGSVGRIRVDGPPLPIASDYEASGLRGLVGELGITDMREGIRRTLDRFRKLHSQGRLPLEDLEA